MMLAMFVSPRGPSRWLAGCAALAVAAVLAAGCNKSGGDADDHVAPKADSAADKAGDQAPGKPNAAGVVLDAEAWEHAGLATGQPTAAQWHPELTAYGTVLDPAGLQGEFMDLGRALLVFDAAHVDLERAKVLQAQKNISEKAFLDAEAAYRQDFAAVEALRLVIQTNWGPKIAELTGDIVTKPGSERKPDAQLFGIMEKSSLIRVDLPAGQRVTPLNQPVDIMTMGETTPSLKAVCLDRLPVMDPATQQESLLCVADKAAGPGLIPGEAVTAQVPLEGAAVDGVLVPDSAVLRFQGAGWVYLQAATNRFVRVAIPLDRPLAGGWFVSGCLAATNTIVTTGVSTVLSTELNAGGFTTGQRD